MITHFAYAYIHPIYCRVIADAEFFCKFCSIDQLNDFSDRAGEIVIFDFIAWPIMSNAA